MNVAKRKLFAGQFKEAHEAAQQALRADPREFEAALVMAAIALEHGNAVGAKKLCDLVANAGHESGWLSVIRGRIALQTQDQEAARHHAVEALKLGWDDPHVANQLGVLLSRTGRHKEAVDPLQYASTRVPDNRDYRYNLAVALQFAGDLAGAERQFAELVERHPDHASAWLALVQLAKEPKEHWHAIIEAQFENATGTNDRLLYAHALARLSEIAGQWDRSFDWLRKGKSAKKVEVAHDRGEVEALVDAAVAAGENPAIAEVASGDEHPLFIVGMPRSGTTLVERILTSHSQVVSVGELSDFAIVLKKALKTPGDKVLDPGLLSAADRALSLGSVGEAYLRRAGVLAGDKHRFIDKMPFNIFYVPAILRALPGARVICLRRSPFDVLFANYRQLFATGFSYYSYGYDFGDTAHFVAHFERLASAFENSLPPKRFLPIRYEEIIADQRGQTERLLEFCGLDWEEACMTFHQNADPVATASSVQVRQPLYSSSIGQWKRYGEGAAMALAELGKYGISPQG